MIGLNTDNDQEPPDPSKRIDPDLIVKIGIYFILIVFNVGMLISLFSK